MPTADHPTRVAIGAWRPPRAPASVRLERLAQPLVIRVPAPSLRPVGIGHPLAGEVVEQDLPQLRAGEQLVAPTDLRSSLIFRGPRPVIVSWDLARPPIFARLSL